MRNLIVLLILITIASLSCVASKDSSSRAQAVLIRKAPGKQLLAITKQEWQGILGPHGYGGYRTVGYWAALEGVGPTFVNPHFQDNPSEFHCIGTITLDLMHNKVRVEMRRVLSTTGKPERTEPHPANGTYSIGTIRDAKPEEAWF